MKHSKVKPSITWYRQDTEHTGMFEEKTRLCFSHNFSISPDGQILFDNNPTRKAKGELLSILRGRGIDCHLLMV